MYMKHNVKEKDTVGMTTAENEVKNVSDDYTKKLLFS